MWSRMSPGHESLVGSPDHGQARPGPGAREFRTPPAPSEHSGALYAARVVEIAPTPNELRPALRFRRCCRTPASNYRCAPRNSQSGRRSWLSGRSSRRATIPPAPASRSPFTRTGTAARPAGNGSPRASRHRSLCATLCLCGSRKPTSSAAGSTASRTKAVARNCHAKDPHQADSEGHHHSVRRRRTSPDA